MNTELKTAINQTAHALAQQQYAAYRVHLMTECKRMLTERRPLAEVLNFVAQAAINKRRDG
jgi:FixJ family two-component response regulator